MKQILNPVDSMSRNATLFSRIKEGCLLVRGALFSFPTSPALRAVYRGMGGNKTAFLLLVGGLAYLLILHLPSLSVYYRYAGFLFEMVLLRELHLPDSSILKLNLQNAILSIFRQPAEATFVLPLVFYVLTRGFFLSEFFSEELRPTRFTSKEITESLIGLLLACMMFVIVIQYLTIPPDFWGNMIATMSGIYQKEYDDDLLWRSFLFSSPAFDYFSDMYKGTRSASLTAWVWTFEIIQQFMWVLRLLTDALVSFCLFMIARSFWKGCALVMAWKIFVDLAMINISRTVFSYQRAGASDMLELLQPYTRIFTFNNLYEEVITFPLLTLIHVLLAIYLLSLLHSHIKKHWHGVDQS